MRDGLRGKGSGSLQDARTAASAGKPSARRSGRSWGRLGVLDYSPLHEWIGRTPLLAPGEEEELGRRLAEGDEDDARAASARLFEANVRLVILIASREMSRRPGAALWDLVQDGIGGLLAAARGFRPEAGRFATYAGVAIERAIILGSRNDGVISPPRRPWRGEFTPKLVKKILKVGSIQAPDAATGAPLAARLAAPAEESAAELERRDEAAGLVIALEELAETRPREAEVIRRRFGIGRERPELLHEVGAALGVTKERVRQIEAKGLARLREALAPGRRSAGPESRGDRTEGAA